MSSPKKRKYDSSLGASYAARSKHFVDESSSLRPLDPALFIQAYEADLIRGTQGTLAAQSLEIVDVRGDGVKHLDQKAGDGLIRWGLGPGARRSSVIGRYGEDEDEEENAIGNDSQTAVWVDRFDARLLLDTLPTATSAVSSNCSSPTGWSDLASDTEDTFFFSPDEAEDYRREKRRRLIDQNRADRLKARRAEDGESEEEDLWGASDEEPLESQKELMRRTATHILSSPNPAQLEMRILANHGKDKRFAFLRGRWGRTWKVIRGMARIEKEKKGRDLSQAEGTAGGLGVLAAYGDSEGESEDESGDEGKDVRIPVAVEKEGAEIGKLGGSNEVQAGDETAREARRARAKEWAEKRRAQQAN